MMHRSIIYLLFAIMIASMQLTLAAVSNYQDGQFEIREGNCSTATVADLVYQDHVHLHRIPFVSRSTESSWHGDQRITCILATSQKDESKGSTVSITEGGLNQHYITLAMKSSTNHGLEYNIQIFGRL